MGKLKARIFDDPQIREPLKDPMFDKSLREAELFAKQSLKLVVTNFLGNYGKAEYEKKIEELLRSFHQIWAQMSICLHFLRLHLDYFPNNCGDLSEDQDECIHHDIRIMEECYQVRRIVNFSADYFWCLKRDAGRGDCKAQNKVHSKTFHKGITSLAYFSIY